MAVSVPPTPVNTMYVVVMSDQDNIISATLYQPSTHSLYDQSYLEI